MPGRYGHLLFTPEVQEHQRRNGSRRGYAAMTEAPPAEQRLTAAEAEFAATRTSFYLASTSASGWPYVQHRGGPPGFLRALDDRTLAFCDYRGNRQYITVGNLDHDDRVALFLMDYPSATRLKILGRARTGDVRDWPDEAGPPVPEGYRAVLERMVRIEVEAYDWNCPQHIEPRFTPAELEDALTPVRQRMAELEAENRRLRAALGESAPERTEHAPVR